MALPRIRSRARSVIAWLLVAAFAIWAIVRVLGLANSGDALKLIVLTPYVAALSLVAVVVIALLRCWVALIAAAFTVALLATAVVPRMLPDSQAQVPGGRTLTVMSLNLHDGQADSQRVMDLIRRHKVDVVSLLELKRSLPALDRAGLRQMMPFRIVKPRARAGGAGLFSRTKLRGHSGPEVGFTQADPGGSVRVGDREVDLRVLHPPHPTSLIEEGLWKSTLKSIVSTGRSRQLRVAMGDFNATLDHRDLRGVLDRGYRDAAAATGAGLRMTWPANRLGGLIAIDHVLADRRIRVESFFTAAAPGTDHEAVIARLRVPQNHS